MILNIILLVIGFVLLIKGADFFVEGASGIAENFKVSKILIGLTIVAFGTSAPEFAVSVKSLLSGSGDIVLGNVIGSNILNILLILGLASLFHPLVVKNNTVKKELPITLMISAAFATLLSDHLFDKGVENIFTRGDGIVLILFFGVFLYYLIKMTRTKVEEESSKPILLRKAIIYTIIGIIGIVLGSNMVVDNAAALAKELGVTERMISLTIIALGTSLPELVTSVVATKKGEYDIAIGNVVGSNIFNIGVVIGIPVAILGGIGAVSFSYIDLLVMLIAAILLFFFSFNDRKISRKEGIIFLLLFITYYSYVVFF
ncbi:MAG: calcium/sodium antiporter [Bacilli bacterium]|nr:calcium/sodium antiporter [Bacilli bacterium]